MKDKLLHQLVEVEYIANANKLQRLLRNPLRYFYAIAFREFIYPKNKQEKIVRSKLFSGKDITIALPASTDIYLTGGKSHVSEIKLARFLIKNLKADSNFLDIGAHYGYFTLIAAELIESGKIFSFEAAAKTFAILQKNTQNISNIQIFHQAMSNSNESIKFYEFDNLHSEYNSTDITQFQNEEWFDEKTAKVTEVKATTIDELNAVYHFTPDIIKIDVEGAEFEVIQGGTTVFTSASPIIIMEYLEPKRKNEAHKKALNYLRSLNYTPHTIDSNGELQKVADVDTYLAQQQLESDNIVFTKSAFA